MKNKSKAINNIIAFAVLLSITIYITKVANNDIVKYLIAIPLVIIVFNFLVRGIPSFKSYFLSPYNFLSAKTLIEKQMDLPKAILVEKFSEVLLDAGFSMKESDKEAGTLFAITGVSWKTWGDNIYIEFSESGAAKFYSVSVIGVYSWGKNDCNLRKLVNQFESSLTI